MRTLLQAGHVLRKMILSVFDTHLSSYEQNVPHLSFVATCEMAEVGSCRHITNE